ncbi:MAG: hypothetical protein B7Z73_02705 [Planctomycetia bacterium 21-64-5]|nr:MAG: hypothetical protein B7Z73_02705 [Planctomycetia bacterium 21-64-5]HQU44399.1 hypothetical protein [Pirellulales bacterium]
MSLDDDPASHRIFTGKALPFGTFAPTASLIFCQDGNRVAAERALRGMLARGRRINQNNGANDVSGIRSEAALAGQV